MKQSQKGTEPWWLKLPWGQMALATSFGIEIAKDPSVQPLMHVILKKTVLSLGACGVLWWAIRPAPPVRTDEDEFAHFGVVGLSRSGKTAWAILKLLEWTRRDWGWCWLSIKGGRGLLPYLPPEVAETVDLISPTSSRPRGINMLRMLTGTVEEREQVADQVADILDRLHPASSDLMREMARLGTLALLDWGARSGREVALPDLYAFFVNQTRRQQVLQRVTNPVIRDAFSDEAGGQKTLEAVQRQVRRLVSSRALLLALGRWGPGQVDIREAMAKGRRIIVDVSDTELGPGQAALINEVIASKVQLYTAQRRQGEPGFGVIADEVQEYQGAGHAFKRALALAAEYRVAWVLINQYREGQLTPAMQSAVDLAGNQVFFRLAARDAANAVKALGGATTPDDLVQLTKRHYWVAERVGGAAWVHRSKTPELPAPNSQVEVLVHRANARGPQAEAVISAIYRTIGEKQEVKLWA